ncbi:hypothetical protein [Halorubrum tebenquichense]|uniref:hypothetical protein n=1 Tax=Halorubrum tebenquichense TaxID=119434 RepID=UPI001267BE12|nr:hypothetical protein [Halorubrum tebenquichense]
MAEDQDNTTPPPTSEETVTRGNIDALIEHQDVFVKRKQQIKKAIDISIENYGVENVYAHIHNNIEIAIAGLEETRDYDEEDWDSLGDAVVGYLHVLTLMESGTIDYLEQKDQSSELQDFLISSFLEYGPALQRISYYKNQGKRWWSSIKTEQVIGNEALKHRHTLTIDRQDDVQIDSTPHSDWVIIEHILAEVITSLDISSGNPEEIVNIPYFEEARRNMYFIEEVVRRSDQDIELTDREDIIGTIETAIGDEEGQ